MRNSRNGRERPQGPPPLEKLSREEYERKKELYRELRKKEFLQQQQSGRDGKKTRDEPLSRLSFVHFIQFKLYSMRSINGSST